jgi:hypothetical protein
MSCWSDGIVRLGRRHPQTRKTIPSGWANILGTRAGSSEGLGQGVPGPDETGRERRGDIPGKGIGPRQPSGFLFPNTGSAGPFRRRDGIPRTGGFHFNPSTAFWYNQAVLMPDRTKNGNGYRAWRILDGDEVCPATVRTRENDDE